MNGLFKKVVSIGLAAVMTASVSAVAVMAQTDGGEMDSVYCRGTYYYRPGTGEFAPLTDSVDYYTYSDDYFRGSSKEFNSHLASFSMALAESSVSSTREPFTPEGYANKSRDGVAFLEDTGFGDIRINDDYRQKPTKDSVGIACAKKNITDDGKTYTLLVIMPRSAGYEAEWGNNFVLGSEGDAKGFSDCSDKMLAFAKAYVAETGISGDIKVWTVGYSRGAAIVNLAAKKLIDDPQGCLGSEVTLTSDNLYAYTFGTPHAADVNASPRDERYAGIFNSFADTELSSSMAPPEMGFDRYGTDKNILMLGSKDDMTANLAIRNPDILQQATEQQIASDLFCPKKLGTVDGSVVIVNDESSYIPKDVKSYLEGLGKYLTEVTGGRDEYAKTYEQPFSDLLSYYESLTGDDSEAFSSTLLNHEDTLSLAASMYAYFMKLKLQNVLNASRVSVNAKAQELAEVAAAADPESTGIDASAVADAAAKLAVYLTKKPAELKRIAAQYLGKVLRDAMTLSGATEEQIAELCNTKSLDSLTHLISHLLLGNIWQSSKVRPLSLDNEQIKNAATLIGNFTNIMVDHANEYIMSWLRLDDSYYDDYAPLTPSQISGYRRVYLKADDVSKLNGDILDGSGRTVAYIKNGEISANKDKWVGFTSTDDGGFFRIPIDQHYKIRLKGFCGELQTVIGEYDCYSAKTTTVLKNSFVTEYEGTVIVSLPMIMPEHASPSGAKYKVTFDERLLVPCLMGDMDGNNIIDIRDVTVIQRALAGITALNERQRILGDVNGDDEVNIMDATCIQLLLGEFEEGRGSAGVTIDLPAV